MKTKQRIASILKAHTLSEPITGIPSFNLLKLDLATNLEFPLPNNLRLGHVVERIVSGMIKTSTNYNVLYENIQLLEGKTTIGELDFILEEIATHQILHVELAYKFYLFDPSISSEQIQNWIGPNRNDSLIEKLGKLKAKQFPLLHHNGAKARFEKIAIEEVKQALCLLVSLFIPYLYKESFDPGYEKAIQGYYLNFETFIGLNHSDKTFYLPAKKEWGMDPSENDSWIGFNGVEKFIQSSMKEEQAPMVWSKQRGRFEVFFVVWW
ncbi:MAG: hypothetical protein ACI85Q_001657 [Salibacteraceae bacterium]|jgi:hypothetical protein